MEDQHFTTPDPVRLEIKVAAGNINVTTVDGDASTVALDGSPNLLATLRVQLLGDRLVIEQQRKSFSGIFGRFGESVDVRAQIPHGSRVEVVTASADTTLDGAFAGLEVQSASGGAALSGELDGNASVKTVSGDVRLPHVSGDLTAHTVSGQIAAESVDGSVSAKSVSGDVRVGSLREGQVTVQSVSGDVELGVAPGTSVDVDAGSASGQLLSDVPLSDAPGGEAGRTLVIRSNTVSGDFRVFRAV
jgi:DUF4097 and DUF4098 domain-containing protein YvlB